MITLGKINSVAVKQVIHICYVSIICYSEELYVLVHAHHNSLNQKQCIQSFKNTEFVKDCLHFSDVRSSKIIVFIQKRTLEKGLALFFNRKLHHSETKQQFSLKSILFCKGLSAQANRKQHQSQAQLLFSLENIGFVKDCLHFPAQIITTLKQNNTFLQKHWFCKGLSAICSTNHHHSQAKQYFCSKTLVL